MFNRILITFGSLLEALKNEGKRDGGTKIAAVVPNKLVM